MFSCDFNLIGILRMTFRRSLSKDIFNSRVQIFLIVEFQIDDQGVHFRHSSRGLKKFFDSINIEYVKSMWWKIILLL